jgi:hypothetical protein
MYNMSAFNKTINHSVSHANEFLGVSDLGFVLEHVLFAR